MCADTQDSEFRILAIDGGGFKGLYSASLLCELERAFGRIIDYFHLLCGTSTGGIIALALAAGKSAEQIVEFYKECGPQIFPVPSRVKAPLNLYNRFVGRKALYDDRALKKGAQDLFGMANLGAAKRWVCIPAYDRTLGTPRVFKTDHGDGFNRDNGLLMSEVAVATAAAPTYFPIAQVQETHGAGYYLDGGLWANNPALVGLLEAGRCFVGSGRAFQSVRLLSIGNVSPPSGWLAEKTYPADPVTHLLGLIEAVGTAQQIATDNTIRFLCGSMAFPVRYERVVDSLAPTQQSEIALDKATQRSMETLLAMGAAAGHRQKLRPEIKAFFSTAISEAER